MEEEEQVKQVWKEKSIQNNTKTPLHPMRRERRVSKSCSATPDATGTVQGKMLRRLLVPVAGKFQ